MTNPTIRIEKLSKKYTLGAAQQAHDTLRDLIADVVRRPFQKHRSLDQPILWALKDVSLEIEQGDAVGLIGRNGAGKSTLLKVLSRITEPTRGRAVIRGRVGSLLEVGTGFHPELTGRENIYLNGAILGMARREIDRKFSEIVDFAEIEKFLDTPVKRYSSGMYVRLAFAVAAHLEPEILLVDEVLAVGDVAFQRKCLGKMSDVAHQGRTVIFVSHNMSAVQSLCNKGVLLEKGQVIAQDGITGVVAEYIHRLEDLTSFNIEERTDRRGKGQVRLVEVVTMCNRVPTTSLMTGSPAQFIFRLNNAEIGSYCRFTIYDSYHRQVAHFNSSVHAPGDRMDPTLGPAFECEIPELALSPGRYWINVAIHDRSDEMQDHVESAALFDVEPGSIGGRLISPDKGYGIVCLPHHWKTGSDYR